MAEQLPPEIRAHKNRISADLLSFIRDIVKNELNNNSSKEFGRLLWNIIEDPMFQKDEEIRYLASKMAVIFGQYDLSVKSMTTTSRGSLVWGAVAQFEIGEVEYAIKTLQQVIDEENTDLAPLIEANIWIIILKSLIGDLTNLEQYKKNLDNIYTSRRARVIPKQFKVLKDFVEGIISLNSINSISGYQKIEEFERHCANQKENFWQLYALLIMGEHKLEAADFYTAEIIYKKAAKLAYKLANTTLQQAAEVGRIHNLYLRGMLKEANLASQLTISKLEGKSQYHLARAHLLRGYILSKLGQHLKAREHFEYASLLTLKYNDINKTLQAMLAKAEDYISTNELNEASKIYDKAYNMVLNISDKKQFIQALVKIVKGDYHQGKIDSAYEKINKIETMSEEILYQKGKTDALRLRAQINIEKNIDIKKQIDTLKACKFLYLEIGDVVSSANCDIILAKTYIHVSKIDQAQMHLKKAKDYFIKVSDNIRIAEIKELETEFDVIKGRYDEALVKLRSSYTRHSDVFNKSGKSRCLRKIGDVLALKGNVDDALTRYKRVERELVRSNQINDETFITRINIARIYTYKGEYSKTKEILSKIQNSLKEEDKGLIKIKKQILDREKGLVALRQGKMDVLYDIISSLKSKKSISSTNHLIEKLYEALYFYEVGEKEKSQGLFNNLLAESVDKPDRVSSTFVFLYYLDNYLKEHEQKFNDENVLEQFESYIGMLKSLAKNINFYQIYGITQLLEIALEVLKDNQDEVFALINSASEYFSQTGIETTNNLILNVQYNVNKWLGTNNQIIDKYFKTPVNFESPVELLQYALNIGKDIICLEKIRYTKNEITDIPFSAF